MLVTIYNKVFPDSRGSTSVLIDPTMLAEQGIEFNLCQINQAHSLKKYTFRGLHFQKEPYSQAKIVSCLQGSIINYAIDLRRNSVNFKKLYSVYQYSSSECSIFIPKGFAHGYLTLEDNTIVQWCIDGEFNAEAAKSINYMSVENDWPGEPLNYIVSEKDRNGMNLQEYF